LETTIVSFLAARRSADADVQALQSLTMEWWTRRRDVYDLRASEIVLREARAGDPEAAARRLEYLRGISLLGLTPEVDELAERIAIATAIPARAKADVFHIAAATVHAVDYLLTWNMKHLANPTLIHKVDAVCRLLGYQAPMICTPEQLLGDSPQ
jgi:hypothetical protein